VSSLTLIVAKRGLRSGFRAKTKLTDVSPSPDMGAISIQPPSVVTRQLQSAVVDTLPLTCAPAAGLDAGSPARAG
jgi:hypothetical protein